MSYNIDSVRYVSGGLTIGRDRALDFADDHAFLPEHSFLDGISRKSPPVVRIERPAWCGEGSGDEGLLKKALARTEGEAELALIWEGGDSVTGLHVKDGVVTDKKVKFVLID